MPGPTVRNLFIKIPGTPEGLPAIEEAIFAGIPINVTLLFSREHYFAAAEAFLRGIERRIAAGLIEGAFSRIRVDPVGGTRRRATRWLRTSGTGLDIAVAKRTYRAYRELLESPRWKQLARAGAPPQRLLWASTGTKVPKASDILYVTALVVPDTINTMPESTLLAFADHGIIRDLMPLDSGDADETIAAFTKAGVDHDTLANHFQRERRQRISSTPGAICSPASRPRARR